MQFDQKAMDHYESDSDDVDESLTVPKPPEDYEVSDKVRLYLYHSNVIQDDPIVEYEDEFGRVRTGRRSEIPRHLLQSQEEAPEKEDEYVHTT